MECARIPVPVNWADPEGESILLAIARLPATGERTGAVVTNPGGPGSSGIQFLARGNFGEELREPFDIVSWDPRGLGASVRVDCTDAYQEFLRIDPSPDSGEEQSSLDEGASAVSEGCARTDPGLLANVHSDAAAADVDAIRKALGEEQINYLGFSYGTLIGQVYAENYGESLRAMVLDGVVDPTMDLEGLLLAQAAGFEATFDDFDRNCTEAGPEECGVADLGAAYDKVSDSVESEPLDAGSNDGATEGAVPEVGPAELATAAIRTAYIPDGWTALGEALESALDNDGSGLAMLADNYRSLADYNAYASVMCTDSPHPVGEDEYAEFATRARGISARLGDAIANELLPCATWSAPNLPARATIAAPAAGSVLVVGNTGDPATPFIGAQAVDEALANSQLVTVEANGHVAYGTNECVRNVVDEYLITAELPPEPLTC
jgi:pimeloyl-ACP methyl ester carboxylesterase